MSQFFLENSHNSTCPNNADEEMRQHPYGWKQIKESEIYMKLNSDGTLNDTMCFCDQCHKWIKKSTTIYNICKHAASHSDYWLDYIEKRHAKHDNSGFLLNETESKHVAEAITKYFILNAQPFKQIGDDNLQSLTKLLPSPKSFLRNYRISP